MSAVLVTGGAGFIGSAFVRHLLATDTRRVVTYDKLTYAGNLENLAALPAADRHTFVRGDVADATALAAAVTAHGVDAVVNFAAESHVDRSIRDAAPFLATNVVGVQVLLDVARAAGVGRIVQVSTDEVYGELPEGSTATEEAPLRPGNPYSASKAAADLLCLAAARTHGAPVVVARSSNNYGPRQHPEKFIPLALTRARRREAIPLYGDGLHERDWIHVDDHCAALALVLARGVPGAVYNIATGVRRTNRDVLRTLLDLVGAPTTLIRAVDDRPGHDRRYAPVAARTRGELGWNPRVAFADGLRETIAWYDAHPTWVEHVLRGDYGAYFAAQYAGLAPAAPDPNG